MEDNMTQAVAKKDAVGTIKHLMEISTGEFQKALPRHLDINRFMRIALTCIRTNPKLAQCSSQSLMAALMTSAQLGLEPDGILGHAYLIPYENRKLGTCEAQFQVGYRGLIALARRSGEVVSFQAQVVYENDAFEFEYGLNEKLSHRPTGGDRGKMIAAYAIVHFKDGGHAFDVMFKEDIEKIKKASKASNSGPWVTYEPEMWRKTVAKRLAKYLPLSVEFQRAATLDEYVDLGLHDMPTQIEVKTSEATEKLKEKLKKKAEPETVEVKVEEVKVEPPADEPGAQEEGGDWDAEEIDTNTGEIKEGGKK